jgi:hypothetical protein
MLEDFVAYLIPPGDTLHPKAKAILQELEPLHFNSSSQSANPYLAGMAENACNADGTSNNSAGA